MQCANPIELAPILNPPIPQYRSTTTMRDEIDCTARIFLQFFSLEEREKKESYSFNKLLHFGRHSCGSRGALRSLYSGTTIAWVIIDSSIFLSLSIACKLCATLSGTSSCPVQSSAVPREPTALPNGSLYSQNDVPSMASTCSTVQLGRSSPAGCTPILGVIVDLVRSALRCTKQPDSS